MNKDLEELKKDLGIKDELKSPALYPYGPEPFNPRPTLKEDYLPPTEEQWARLSEWARWKIFFMVLWETLPSQLAELGLKLAGKL